MRTLLLAAAVARLGTPSFPGLLNGLVAVGGETIRLFKDGNVEDHVPEVGYVWNDVIVANGMIVAVSNLGKRIAYKPLVGGSWTISNAGGILSSWRAVTYIDGNFYFLGYASSDVQKLIYTADFVSWFSISLPDSTNEEHFKMSTFNGKLLVPSRIINRVKSIDPVTKVITAHAVDFGAQSYYPVAFKVVNGVPFALGQGRKVSVGTILAGVIQYTFNLRVGVTQSSHARDVEYLPTLGKYVVVGSYGSGQGTSPLMYVSDDTVTWTLVANINDLVGATNGLQSIQVIDDVAYIGSNDGRIFKTMDLINFEVFSTLPGNVFNLKAY
ncbi:hypothetical protein D9M68_19550 [compost metagenome]